MSNIALGEPLVEDKRLWAAADRLGVIFPDLPRLGYDLVTWLQEEMPFEDGMLPKVACFGIISPHPTDKERDRLTRGAAWYTEWEELEMTAAHYVGANDPLVKIFKPIARAHIESMKNSEDLIN